MFSIVDYLQKWAKFSPHTPFVYEEDRCWSFKTFYEDVLKLSRLLQTKGIVKGDYVLVHLEQKSQHLLTYMALLQIGAICVHLYPERENDYVIFAAKVCHAKAIISTHFKELLSGCIVINRLDYDAYKPLNANNGDRSEVAYLMFTSGTTSTPKAVQTTHENILFVTQTLIHMARMEEQKEKEVIFMPLGSTGGLGHFHACLMLGNSIRLLPGFYAHMNHESLEMLLDVIEQENITGVLLTPSIIVKLLKEHKTKFALVGQKLHYALANVTPMRKEVIEELLSLLPYLHFCTYYGSTEASRCIVNVCRNNSGYEHFTGRVVEGVEIKIESINAQGEGEILIRGANVMKGYLGRGDEGFIDEWFKSGDIGRVHENGLIQVLGRIKDTISIDGLKIFPSELENVVLEHRSIKDAGVCPLSDECSFHQIGLVVVLDQMTDKKQLSQEIYHLLKTKFKVDETPLYRYKIPKKIYFEEKIPRTDLGKIKRDDLAKLLAKNNDPYFITLDD
jgi:acyl-CoA synthetase (AMP-forming)/AMP-acid ligase II